MTVQTGRTVEDFVSLLISNGAAMVVIPIDSLGDLGLDYPAVDMAAWQDAVKGVLIGKPDFKLDFGGPVDNTATTGASTILRAKSGSRTASSFDVQIGTQHAWEAGESQFGLTAAVASNSGVIFYNYKESGGKFKCSMACTAGTAVIPAWGTAAETVPA